MSAPSIGRIVLFHDRDVGPCAAIITACEFTSRVSGIPNERSYTVRVTVFYPGQTVHILTNVPYGDEVGQWSWPPRVP